MNDLLVAIEMEMIRLRATKSGKYYKLRIKHLARLLDLCESLPALKMVIDDKFFSCYVTRLCMILGREMKRINSLVFKDVTCILDLHNLRRIFGLLQEEMPIASVVTSIKVKIKHRGRVAVWIRRWADNHQDTVNTLPGAIVCIFIIVVMIISELAR